MKEWRIMCFSLAFIICATNGFAGGQVRNQSDAYSTPTPQNNSGVKTKESLPHEVRATGLGEPLPGLTDWSLMSRTAWLNSIINALYDFAAKIEVKVSSSMKTFTPTEDIVEEEIKDNITENSYREVINERFEIGKFEFTINSLLKSNKSYKEGSDVESVASHVVKIIYRGSDGYREIKMFNGRIIDPAYVKYYDELYELLNQGGFKTNFKLFKDCVICELDFKRDEQ